MKIIRITTDNNISVHEFPNGSNDEVYSYLCELIGSKCELFEEVLPRRLYTAFGGSDVNMLVDECGIYHELDVNIVGSFLYESDIHGSPILGNILIAGREWTDDGIDICGMTDEQFDLLYPRFEKFIKEWR